MRSTWVLRMPSFRNSKARRPACPTLRGKVLSISPLPSLTLPRLNRRSAHDETAADASLPASFLDDWPASVSSERILRLDVTHGPPDYSGRIPVILAHIAE